MQLSLCHLHYVVNRVHEWFMRCTSFCQQSAWMMDEMGIILSTECMVDWWDYHGNMSNILWIRVLSGRQDQDRSLYWQSAVWLTRSRPLTVLTECRVADKIKTAHCIDRVPCGWLDQDRSLYWQAYCFDRVLCGWWDHHIASRKTCSCGQHRCWGTNGYGRCSLQIQGNGKTDFPFSYISSPFSFSHSFTLSIFCLCLTDCISLSFPSPSFFSLLPRRTSLGLWTH